MDEILKKLGLDDTLSKTVPKEKKFTTVKSNIPLKENLNFMADLLFMPKDNDGNMFCLVVCDLADNSFDIEPVSNKEPATILQAIKKMNKRKYIKIDKHSATLTTDNGGEFQGIFAKWMYDESIYHKTTLPGRHTQLANIDYLCRQLGKLFNTYMNTHEIKTGKVFRNWSGIIDQVRSMLNEHRKIVLPKDITTYQAPIFDFTSPPNKYKVNDIVLRKLDAPENALGHKVYGKFRKGDMRWSNIPYKITKVLYYPAPINYRYMLSGVKGASFTEPQLMPSKEIEEKYVIRGIVDKRKVGSKIEYKIWWKGYLKKDATWEPRSSIIKDVPDLVKSYEKENK